MADLTTSLDVNIGPAVLKANWVQAAVATIIVILRLYTRARIVKKLGWDDLTMVLALVLGIINTALVTVSISWGLGRHLQFLSHEQQTQAVKYDYLSQPFAIMSPCLGRISFALLLIQIISRHRKRCWFLYSIIVTQLVVNILCFVLILAQCKPINAMWDNSVKAHCWSLKVQEYYGFAQGSWNSLTDLILALFPATIMWNLNMRLALKISLVMIMGLGVFAMVASVVKTVELKSVAAKADYTYDTTFLIIWWTIELYLVIIAASVPALKPLIIRTSQNRSKRTSYPMSSFHHSRKRRGYTPHDDTTVDIDIEAAEGKNKESVASTEVGDGSKADKILPCVKHGDIRKTTKVLVEYGSPSGMVQDGKIDPFDSQVHCQEDRL